MEIYGKKFTVIGIARSGIAAAKKLTELGGEVFLSDNKPQEKIENAEILKKNFACEFGGHSQKVLQADKIIVSPGVPLSLPILKQAQASGIELLSEIELGFRLKSPDSKIICVTGSNGKSTTVSLIHHILLTCGYHSILGGNIGTPFTAFPIEKPGIDFIVLELSSFQLELVKYFKADAAIILNITPDHLDRYKDFEHYARTKFNIFQNMEKNDLAVMNLDDETIRRLSEQIKAGRKWFSLEHESDAWRNGNNLLVGKDAYKTAEISIAGPHNMMNCLAALLATARYTAGRQAQVCQALKTFASLPHRLEYVTTSKGIRFINDSKATNTDAVKYALLSFTEGVHIILGGSDKGEDYSILLPYLQRENVHTYLIGATRTRMQAAFAGALEYEMCQDMETAMKLAYSRAAAGEVILLSPACASYDAFRNYLHRGDTFRKIAEDIAHEI
ncbi:MAG: UDP-N-acetylmuramoyl-L-alanine--D-glutamate ligase [Candidatus Cloacimonetes bacterium]|nr:UDP-N-acetylmuramoyl-L-alanine--D-glutamate ligase [Candidatus Cloacimonadota bacterium]